MRYRTLYAVATFSVVTLLVACTPAEDPSPSKSEATDSVTGATPIQMPDLGLPGKPEVLLVPDPDTGDGSPIQWGDIKLALNVATYRGGQLREGVDLTGQPAFRFPGFADSDDAEAAVIVARPAEASALDPGTRSFQFGADFQLNAKSEGTPFDNGNNLIQRGLSSDSALFKAEVDRGRPACTVRGSEGESIVRGSWQITPRTWYRLRCIRQGNELIVRTLEYGEDGTIVDSRASSVKVPIGEVQIDGEVPLTVGGKTSHSGQVIKSASDQFNGSVINALVNLD